MKEKLIRIQNVYTNNMRIIVLLTIIFISSCESKKETPADRLEAIVKEKEQVNTSYYKKIDGLEKVRRTGTDSMKRIELAKEITSTDNTRIAELLKLQKEFDSLEKEIKKQVLAQPHKP